MKMTGFANFLCFALAGLLACAEARAQTVEEFYRGNVLEIYNGFTVGSGYDAHMRLVARHIGKHIPGHPTVVPLNMEGAGSLKLTNWLYTVAPQDGTVIGVIARGIPFEPLVGIAPPNTLLFEATKFTWIGSTTDEVSVCAAWERAGIDEFSDLYEKELIVGGVGAGGGPDVFPRILDGVLGAKFRIVSGYPGGADLLFAMERGEVDGRCGWSWASLIATNQRWLDEGKVKILIQLSRAPHPDLTAMGVPWIMDLAKTEEDRQLFRMIFARGAVGRPFIAPPNLPADRAAALRQAFEDTMRDPEFLADAHQARLEIVPMTGEEAQQLIAEVYATPRPIVDRARAMLRPNF
jgi:tripartite-type tricarboxylate transporter receptor subunit TctC